MLDNSCWTNKDATCEWKYITTYLLVCLKGPFLKLNVRWMNRSQWPNVFEAPWADCLCAAHRAVPVHVATRDQTLVTGAVYGPDSDVFPLWTPITHTNRRRTIWQAQDFTKTDTRQAFRKETLLRCQTPQSCIFFFCNMRWLGNRIYRHLLYQLMNAYEIYSDTNVYLLYHFSSHRWWKPYWVSFWGMLCQTHIAWGTIGGLLNSQQNIETFIINMKSQVSGF